MLVAVAPWDTGSDTVMWSYYLGIMSREGKASAHLSAARPCEKKQEAVVPQSQYTPFIKRAI